MLLWLSELEILDSSIAIVESSTTELTLKSLLCDLSFPTAVPAAILDKITENSLVEKTVIEIIIEWNQQITSWFLLDLWFWLYLQTPHVQFLSYTRNYVFVSNYWGGKLTTNLIRKCPNIPADIMFHNTRLKTHTNVFPNLASYLLNFSSFYKK